MTNITLISNLRAYTFSLLVLLCANTMALGEEASSELKATMPKKHFLMFQRYCLDCHDSDTQEGKVDLESINFNLATDIATAERWAKILNAINSGEMPPEDSEAISDNEKLAFLNDLSIQMVNARKILSDSGGVITMRRLNRREYQNTIEQLLGIRPDVSNLPNDQSGSGFDTAGASLFFSSDQLEQYLIAARKTLQLAINPIAAKSQLVRVEPEAATTKLYEDKLAEKKDIKKRAIAYLGQSEKTASEFGFIDQGKAEKQLRGVKDSMPQLLDYLSRPETKHGATLIVTPKGGAGKVSSKSINGGSGRELLIRVRAGAYKNVTPRYQYLEFSMRSWSHGYTKQLGWRKVNGSIENPDIIEFPVKIPPGEKVQFYVHQRTHQGRGDKNLLSLHKETIPTGTPPGLWIDWVEFEYSAHRGLPSKEMQQIFFEMPSDWSEEQYAKEVIQRFATKAFRTEEPLPEYLDNLYERYRSKRIEGIDINEALIEPLAIVLSSPSFLYMVESTGGDEALTDLELAVRLSYFLWSSSPDEELIAIAREGDLSNPEILKQQTIRLLADEKADRFVRGFASQWLGLSRLGMFQFDARTYPTFDNGARESAREEVIQTIHTLLQEGLPLQKLLNSDFVVINDILADYYEIEGVQGHQFQKVMLPSGSPRGGLLGTAAVLAMGSDGIRTSPVERGAWVLRHLINNPPPPAPPNVPQISRLEGQVLSARQLQQAHQEEPQCAQCHRKIDPIGFGLENFDAAGLWREIELVRSGSKKKQIDKFPIDPSGTLPNGEQFSDYFSLRDSIAQKEEEFAQGFTEALIEYGLGRPYGFTDKDLADQILAQAKADKNKFSSFIVALIQSNNFQSK